MLLIHALQIFGLKTGLQKKPKSACIKMGGKAPLDFSGADHGPCNFCDIMQ